MIGSNGDPDGVHTLHVVDMSLKFLFIQKLLSHPSYFFHAFSFSKKSGHLSYRVSLILNLALYILI